MSPQKKKLLGERLFGWPRSYPDGRGERRSVEDIGCGCDIPPQSLFLRKVRKSRLPQGGAANAGGASQTSA